MMIDQQQDYTHRLARIEDLPAIVAIYNSTIASRMVTADTEEISVESRLNWFHEHKPETRPLWVVEGDKGEILGWLSYSNFYGRPAYSGTAELSIYLHTSMRGKGLGKYLLREAITFAPKIGVHTVLGFIFGHNVPSMNLFASFNFEIWATLPRVANLDGIERDLIIFGKRVD
ncbi:N-acetyltransferase family protein [Undibacterium cyanobacteriorum]|uniref:N-acetyltransferase family protein n=1 Tax=Undibacterium cyanobacteriorum TaxID=3073561 RepID=A0ABY9RCB4_9BURK|nr:N-acetyltransferase family protein [Undibacterium sp. 20NA77.5]WMW78905.1 N-acetyltransferase family protein [Undibacterium sp. 20NA77.5]